MVSLPSGFHPEGLGTRDWTLGTAAPKPVCTYNCWGRGQRAGHGGSEGERAPVVPEGVGRGLLDAHEGLGVQDAVVHMDWVATVLPLSLCLWDPSDAC